MPNGKITLRPYQQRILEELSSMPAIGLFMGTGTGKTITSLFRAMDNDTPNLLVVCPSKVTQQWEAVIKDVAPQFVVEPIPASWTSKRKNKHIESMPRESFSCGLVLSVESVSEIPAVIDLIDETWTVIVDESHKIKEWGTARKPIKRTHAVLAIGRKTPYKIILTATPTQKKDGGYVDYFTQLQFLGYFEGWTLKTFQNNYCIMDKMQLPGTPFPFPIIKSYRNTEGIEMLLQATCRRYVASFGDFDPEHMVVPIPKAKNYAKLVREKWYEDLDLTSLTSRRLAKKGMTTGMVFGHDTFGEKQMYADNTHKIEWLYEFLSNTDETVVVFYEYNVELAQLESMCKMLKKNYIVLNGKTKNKYAEIQKPNYDVVLGQFAAAGESVDGLQHRSHICVYFAMPESSLSYRQALGRIDRDGQTLVPMYYYLVMEGTIDQDIYDMIQNKIEFSEDTLNKLEVKDD